MIRPGTVDYSRWDRLRLDSSDSDEAPSEGDGAVVPVSAPPPAPPQPVKPVTLPASVVAIEPEEDKADAFGWRVLKVLLYNEPALAAFGRKGFPDWCPSKFLPEVETRPELLAVVHDLDALFASVDAPRGAAKLRLVCKAASSAACLIGSPAPERLRFAKAVGLLVTPPAEGTPGFLVSMATQWYEFPAQLGAFIRAATCWPRKPNPPSPGYVSRSLPDMIRINADGPVSDPHLDFFNAGGAEYGTDSEEEEPIDEELADIVDSLKALPVLTKSILFACKEASLFGETRWA